MKYVVLLRGINVGNSPRIAMKDLKLLIEGIGFTDVCTYINSGNILFESDREKREIETVIGNAINYKYCFHVPVLVKSREEIREIASVIPEYWQNNKEQKTDVAFLFSEIDSEETIHQLPLGFDYLDIRYVPGAIIWNVTRENQNKSRLNKLVGYKYYQFMTIRNVNTARYLAQ